MNLFSGLGLITILIQSIFPAAFTKTPNLTEEGPVYIEGSIDDATLEAKPEALPLETPSISADYTDIANKIAEIDLPLVQKDYYWGKFENGKAGVDEMNAIGTLEPGDRVSIIGNGYITLNPNRGYIQPQSGYYYGSGLCWSVSALGGVMDEANKVFRKEHGFDLFVFNYGDRFGHSHTYPTYGPSNNGYGYSIIKVSSGKGQVDYTFRVNPKIAETDELKNSKFRIELTATDKHPTAYKGQSIKAYVYTNIKELNK